MVFQEIAAKFAIGFFSYIDIFENADFGHLSDVPISMIIQSWIKICFYFTYILFNTKMHSIKYVTWMLTQLTLCDILYIFLVCWLLKVVVCGTYLQ